MYLDPVIEWSLALFLAGLWGTAAMGKLRAPDAFEGVVANYRILPPALVAPFARGLPWLELAVAAALLVPILRPAGALASAGLFLLFALAMAINIRRGRTEIDCGCFVGFTRSRIGRPLVIRNLLLAAAALLLLLPVAPRPLAFVDLVTLVGAAAVLLASHLALSQLLERPEPEGRA